MKITIHNTTPVSYLAMKPSFPVRAGSLLIFGLLHFMVLRPGFSQCTGLDFSYPATTCLGQSIDFAPVGNYQKYEWDFCADDLSQTPTSSILTNAFGGHSFKVELVEQNGFYYGFLLGQNTGALYRLDFGTDINNQPTLVNLGGIGINSGTWRVIEVVKEGNTYYGFIMDAANIYRVTFGTSLTNTPAASQVIYSGLFYNTDMVIVEDGASKFLFVASPLDGNLLRMSFPLSFTDTPTLLPQITTTAISIGGISFLRECETWHCVASGYGNARVYNISFGAGKVESRLVRQKSNWP